MSSTLVIALLDSPLTTSSSTIAFTVGQCRETLVEASHRYSRVAAPPHRVRRASLMLSSNCCSR